MTRRDPKVMELQWPEMVPGEWKKQNEVNKDRDKVVGYMDQIELLLKLYRRPNEARQPTPGVRLAACWASLPGVAALTSAKQWRCRACAGGIIS